MKKTAETTKSTLPLKLPFLTIRNVAERLQISERTIHRLISGDELTVVRVGRSVRISEDALLAFLTRGDKP